MTERTILLRELVRLKKHKHDVAEFIISVLLSDHPGNQVVDVWSLCDNLYILADDKFIDDYIKIASDKKLGADRQMLFLLFGKLKNDKLLPILIDNISDESVNGHVLTALKQYPREKVEQYFMPFVNDKRKWVQKMATEYLKEYETD